MSDNNELDIVLRRAVALVTPMLDTAPARKTQTGAIMTVIRPYVEAIVTGFAPKTVTDQAARRERPWLISLEFVDVRRADVVAISDGRTYRTSHSGRPAEIYSYGGDTVQGLNGAADLVELFARHVGAPLDTFGAAPMRRALGYLRPTISRQHGHATMRRTSEDKQWHLIMDVFREDAFPKDPAPVQVRRPETNS